MFNKSKHLTGALLLGSATLSSAVVTFNFNYTDNGVGFNDPNEGAARRATLEQAGREIAELFSNYDADIFLDVDGADMTQGTLAAAGSNYNAPIGQSDVGFIRRGDVMLKILGGNSADPNSSLADGTVTWNFANNTWELGDDFQAGEFDFLSTAKHELLHAVGFTSDIAQNGTDPFGTMPGSAGVWSPFDEFIQDASGNIIGSNFALDGARWDAGSIGGTGASGLSFNGPNAVAANGGNPIFLFTPNPWEDGSSGSHFDDTFYNGRFMMESAAAPGRSVREVSPIELGLLRDLGYTQIVPEPSSALLLGLASFGLVGRRSRRA